MRLCSFSLGSSMYFIRGLKAFGSPHCAMPSAAPTPSARSVMPRIARPPAISPSMVTSSFGSRRVSAFSSTLPRLLVLEPADVAHGALGDHPLLRERRLLPFLGQRARGIGPLAEGVDVLGRAPSPPRRAARWRGARACSWIQKMTASSASLANLLALVRMQDGEIRDHAGRHHALVVVALQELLVVVLIAVDLERVHAQTLGQRRHRRAGRPPRPEPERPRSASGCGAWSRGTSPGSRRSAGPPARGSCRR